MSKQSKVCYTAIFGDYEELKTPAIIPDGWRFICYTDQPLKSDVWEIVQMNVIDTPQRTARWVKIMGWIDWQYSIWVDASFRILVDLNDWWALRFKSPFSSARHPLRSDIYAESRSCVINNRGDNGKVQLQEDKYRLLAFPMNTGIITSGIMLRENTPDCIKLHEAWWKELSEQSVRDQLSFAFVSYKSPLINTYIWDYGSKSQKDFIYSQHYHNRK
jgi:hypothetical protein